MKILVKQLGVVSRMKMQNVDLINLNVNTNNYLVIPVSLCYLVLRKRLSRPFQIYLWLKINTSGKLRVDKVKKESMMIDCKIKSKKTINKDLLILEDQNWIGHNKISGYYFIRGFDTLRYFYKQNSRVAVIFEFNYLTHIKEFLFAVVIGDLLKKQERKRWRTDLKRGRSKQLLHLIPYYHPISLDAISKVLNISKSTAHNYKDQTKRIGFINFNKDYICSGINIEDKTQLYFHLSHLRKYHPKIGNRMTIKENDMVIKMPDLISSNIIFKRRKKLNYI